MMLPKIGGALIPFVAVPLFIILGIWWAIVTFARWALLIGVVILAIMFGFWLYYLPSSDCPNGSVTAEGIARCR